MPYATSTVLAVLAIAATAASTGVAVAGAQAAASAQEKASKFNEAVAKNNAIAAQDQAAYEADRIRRRNKHLLGEQSALIGKSGVDLSGSASDLMYDTGVQGEMDRLAALYTGKVKSGADRSSADLARLQGSQAQGTADAATAGSVLSGLGAGASIYGKYDARSERT